MLIMLKSCPRCNGDLFIDRDRHGLFLQCLQCGYLRDLRTQFRGEEQVSVKGKEPVLAPRYSNGKEVQNGSIREVWQIEHPAHRGGGTGIYPSRAGQAGRVRHRDVKLAEENKDA